MSAPTSSNTTTTSRTIQFKDGAVQFRLRLICSILTHRPLLIRNIRSDDIMKPGLRPHEVSFLRLLDQMTNGSVVEINATGTQLRFKPGLLLGGTIVHDCPVGGDDDADDDGGDGGGGESVTCRSVGWFLEGILPLSPFGKESLDLTLTGITDGLTHIDPSPDYLSATAIPLLQRFHIGATEDDTPPPILRMLNRGSAPKGGGRIQFFCPQVKELTPLDFTDMGKIKRIRGMATSTKISPSSVARVAYGAKGLLHRLLPDVWIHTDAHSTKTGCGPSPGLNICLTAESTTGVLLSAECGLNTTQKKGGGGRSNVELPEDLGIRAASLLLEEIKRGGCIDTTLQTLTLLLMCLCPEDICRVRCGTLSQYTIQSLRLFKLMFGIEFRVRAEEESKTVLLSCLGSGYRNMARAST